MENHVFKKLLLCYLEKRATPAQRLLLREALIHPENKKLYYEVIHEWEVTNPQLLPDTDSDWKKLSERINADLPAEKENEVPSSPQHPRIIRHLWIAAGLTVFFMITFWQKDRILFHHYQTAFGETREIKLPDGSDVTLNANSKLLFSRLFFFKKEREVLLTGEAGFSVIHTKDHRPFVIRTPDRLQVRVLGTKFLVYSRRERSKVVLTSGSIELTSMKTNASPVLIKPGEVVDINPQGQFYIAQSEAPEEHFLWKDKRFIFNKTPLCEIAKQVQERFGVKIIIPDPTLAETPITGNYPAETADEIVSMLSTILHLEHSRPDKTTILLQKL